MARSSLRLILAATALAFAAAPALADTAYDRGAAAFAKGDPSTARVELLNAIKENPEDGRAHLLQGRVYLALADGVAADAEIRRARETGIAAGQTHHLLAQALLLQGKLQEAIDEAAKAPASFAGEADRVAGRAYAAQGRLDEAGAAFDRAASRIPRDAGLWSDIGRLRIAAGDLDGARAAAARAIQLDGKALDPLLLQGDLARLGRDSKAALGWYDRALAAHPKDIKALIGRAGALSDAGRMRDMLALTREVLKRDGKNGMAFYLQARLAAMAGKYEVARALLQRAGDTLDDYPAARLLDGIVEYRTGNYQQAIEKLGKIVATQPGNYRARRLLAAAEWRAGSIAQAADTVRPLLDSIYADRFVYAVLARASVEQGDLAAATRYRTLGGQPNPRTLVNDVVQAGRAAQSGEWTAVLRRYQALVAQTGEKDARLLNNLAWAYYQTGKVDQALTYAAKAHALAPEDASVLDTYGWLQHEAGRDRDTALAMLEAAAQKAPNNATVRWHLAQAYAAEGRADEARRELQTVMADEKLRDQAEALLAKL